MPFEDLPSRLEDILDAIEQVQEFTAGRSFDDYLRDTMFRLATERYRDYLRGVPSHSA